MSPSVYAVMSATIEVPIRTSSVKETLEELHQASKKEAEEVLRNRLPKDFKVIGSIKFSHAVVK
tara:strand:- start:1349 stop:1540 length:192 start_codon:yes stop_codon:yes gene_type:complete